MKKPTATLYVVALLVLSGALIFYLVRNDGAPPSRVVAGSDEASLPLIVNDAQRLSIPNPTPSSNLPPRDTPLLYTIDQLKRLDAQGDAGATCRLAAEYAFCAQLEGRREEFDRWLSEREQTLDLISTPEARSQLAQNIELESARRQARLGEIEKHCEGVEMADTREIVRLWQRSAHAGNPAAMKQYASGNAFRWNGILNVLQELDAYRKEAGPIATAAAQRGDFDLVLMLAASYSPHQIQGGSLLAQAVKPDPARALALYRFAQGSLERNGHAERRIFKEVSRSIARLERDVNPDQLERASRILTTELSSWTPPVIRGVEDLSSTGRFKDADRDWCRR